MSLFEGQIPEFLRPNAPTTPLFTEEGDLENPEVLRLQQLLNARRTAARNPFLGTSVPDVARAQGAGSLTSTITSFLAAGLTPTFGAGPFVSQLRAPQFRSGGPGPQQQRPGVGNATTASMSRLSQPSLRDQQRARIQEAQQRVADRAMARPVVRISSHGRPF